MSADQASQRIIIIGPAHPLRPGGITTFNERLCLAFQQAGHRCTILSFSLQYPSFLFPGESQFTEAPPPAGIDIRSVINSVNPLNWWRVGCMLLREKPDLIVVRYWIPLMAPCLGTILRVGRGKARVIAIADNIIPHEKRPGDRLLTRYFVPAVDRFVVMSQQVLRDLRRFSQRPASLVPHPLYDNFGEAVSRPEALAFLQKQYKLPVADTDKILLFFGLIRDYKGLDLLLQALKTVTTTQVKLLVAGEWYTNKQDYQALLQDAALSGRLAIFDRFIPSDEVRYFFGAADVVVQPYRSATQSGVTPVAYHFNKPMIVTNVGGLPEMVPHGRAGIVCEPEPMALSAAIETFFELGAPVFAEGLQQVKQKLSWPALVHTLLHAPLEAVP